MKLAILSQYYPPEIGAPQARLSALAEGFVRRGHEVTVLAAMPNYPTGRVQEGYGGLLAREARGGVSVIRSCIYPTQRTDLVRRLACYLSFTASAAVAGAALLGRHDYLFVESPPLFLGLTGLLLSRLKSSRMVFNVSDLWPESAVRLGVVRDGSVGHRISARLEAACYRRAWLVTGQTRAIVADIARRFPDCDTYHLPNGVNCDAFSPGRASEPARDFLGPGGRCTVLYAGLHGLAQGLEQIVDAAETLGASAPIDFVFVGDGPARESLIARAAGLAHIRFEGPRPHHEIPALLASADVIVVSLHPSLADAVPSKLYEALASGRPVVLIAGGDAATIVASREAGLVVAPADRNGLVEAFRRLADDPGLRRRLGEHGRVAAVELFDRDRIVDAFADLLESGLRGDGMPTRARRDPVPLLSSAGQFTGAGQGEGPA
jgi:glycosyltransferase involved in cell wall biosynthesis